MNKKTNTEILVKKAEQYIIFDKLNEAEELLRTAIKQDDSNSEAHYLLGEALCKQGLFQESVAELETANKLLPNNARIHQLLGWAIHMNGDSEKGKILLLKSLEELPDDISILCDLAVLEIKEQNFEKAERYAAEAIKKEPDNSMAEDVFQNTIRFANLGKLVKEEDTIN